MAKLRVLLLYISEVSGHHQATIAIESALRILRPDVEILNLNAFNYTNPFTEKIINRLYLGVIKRTPGIWDYLYDNPSVIESTQKIKEAIHKHNSPKFKRLFDEFRPDAVVCSQAFPCGMAADFKKRYNSSIPLVGVLTDYAPHSYWIYDTVDYYIAPSEEVKDRFIHKGVASDKIRVYGIPISPKFSLKHNKEELAKKFGLNLNRPIILAMGGGQGLGPLNKIVSAFKKMRINSQLAVVAGSNKKLYRKLERKAKSHKKKIFLYGFINNIDELMEIANIIITKAGGLTTAEAFCKGLPMVIIKPLPGQEEINTTYFLNKGAAVKITDDKLILQFLQDLLSNPSMLKAMREAALKISKPYASLDIGKLILELCLTTSSTA
ncbi:MAG: glycosyltransferase [Candidatus Omnitrophota bacterium]|nr:glycosyltransferase [Candidatus Omnitrophota bacterium]